MKRKILSVILAATMTATAFGTSYVANAAETTTATDAQEQEESFKIDNTKINKFNYDSKSNYDSATISTDEVLNFTSTSTGGKGDVAYRYFISDGSIMGRRTEIPAQGYTITRPGTYRINVRADDAKGNTTYTDFMITVKFDIKSTKINGSLDKTVKVGQPLYFRSESTSTTSDVTYRYFISNGSIMAQRTEIAQGYVIDKVGEHRINVRADDAEGNSTYTDFMVNVVD